MKKSEIGPLRWNPVLHHTWWNPVLHHTWTKAQLDQWVTEYGRWAFDGGQMYYIRSRRIANSKYYDVWFTATDPFEDK